MNQYFTHYENWEDWKNGMYRDVPKSEHEKFVSKAVECLINPESAMLSVVIEWKEATKENLTDRKANRKSWLGQAACCYQYGCPEQCTREAWSILTPEQRENANNVAKIVIELWESTYLENQY